MKRSLSDLLPDVETREFKVENIDLTLIKESTSQARKKFDNTKIQELKNSMDLDTLYFWGKIIGTCSDYFVVFAEEKTAEPAKVKAKKYFWAS